MNMNKHSLLHSALALAVMALSASASAAPAAAKTSVAEGSQAVIVAYKAGMAAAVRREVENAGGKIVRELGRASAFAVRMPAARLAELQASTNVDFVEADAERHLLGVQTRTMDATAQPLAAAVDTGSLPGEVLPYGIPMVQANKVHDAYTGNRKLCIVDSGFDRTHPDLAGNNANVTGINLTEPVSGTWDSDENSHGSHVAGTIAAIGGNGGGVVGVNPGGHLKLHIAKVFDATGSATSSTVMEAVSRCADAGANIISMSLGGGDPTQAERRVFRSLLNEGVLTIAAAGNAGDTTTSYPAGYEEVMSVAALDANMVRAGFSQVNNDVEIAAPGVATLSTIPPNIESMGQLSVAGTPYAAAGMTGSPRLTATAALYNFGVGTADDAGAAGKVCLIERGVVSFAEKVLRCQNSGGVAAVVYNSLGRGMLFGTLGGAATSIPSIGTSSAIGATLKGMLGQSATVGVVPDPALYAYFNGTSMATPHVSGVAALVWSHFPKCSAKQIRQVLNASAMELGRPGKDPEFGFGLVQAKAAYDRLAATGCGN
ncbi:S8 family serine peptidase [Roseateles oligotrophus]|uniref:S8 family serine peptidase n=1 Tax=Roseateles oligotrophus TaxID=1769250 RepID=A0ABT2YLM3_9BURK|nr:S8 family serine peptidase [Roseateles oligotrophus]MCV2370948.1 S8 family serine peptidase [Roseateles oligotrophus]